MPNTTSRKKQTKSNNRLFYTIGIATFAIFTVFLSLFGLLLNNVDSGDAQAASTEPQCQTAATSPTWNPYPLQTNFPNPTFVGGTCNGMPLLNFFPIDTGSAMPREKTIIRDEVVTFHVYYNNGDVPGGANIANPRLRTEIIKESETRWRIRASLTGDNATTVTSAQKGGDLIVNVPTGTDFSIVARNTDHFPDAIERKAEADTTGRQPNDNIPDNTVGSNVSNPIYTRFDTEQLASDQGFLLKSGGLEPRFLGYGYVLGKINVDVNPAPANLPPAIPGEEITIIRGESGSFQPLAPTDPDNNYPVTTNVQTQLPSFCSLTGTPNAQGGGQVIVCQTDQNTPVRTEFVVTPTDSLGLVGTPGTFIVNVIEPSLDLTKTCVVKGTQDPCSSRALSAGDEVSYRINANNTSNVILRNLRIVDDYDQTKISAITNVSDSGQVNTQNGIITWANLGDLNGGQSKAVTYDATIANSVVTGDVVVNTATASADNLPPVTASTQFTIGGSLNAVKRCFVKDSATPCESGNLQAGGDITYEIEVTNSTTSEVNDVKVVDTYDRTKLTDITNINPNGTLDVNAGTVTWDVGDMAAGASTKLRFDAKIAANVAPGAIIENVAIVSSRQYPDIRVTHQFPISGPRLAAQKVCYRKGTSTPCNASAMLPGQEVTYIVNVRNNGQATARNTSITDTYNRTYLTGITNIDPTGTHDTNAGTITWNLGDLGPNQERAVRFDATISQSTPNGTVIVNVAIARAENVPDVRVQVDFPVGFVVAETPRSGGAMALALLILGIAGGAGGFYYYKQNSKKFADGFAPSRSTEAKVEKKQTHKSHKAKKK